MAQKTYMVCFARFRECLIFGLIGILFYILRKFIVLAFGLTLQQAQIEIERFALSRYIILQGLPKPRSIELIDTLFLNLKPHIPPAEIFIKTSNRF